MKEKKTDSTTLVNFRVDPAVKESAEAALAGMGLNVSAYVGMCLRQVAQDRQIPFTPSVNADFWMAENAVSDAMQIIDSGLFKEACEAKEAMESQSMLKALDFLRNNKNAIYLDLVSATDMMGTYGKLVQLPAVMENSLFKSQNDGDEEDRKSFFAFIDEFKAWIVDFCRSFLDEHGVEHGDGDEDTIKAFDRLTEYPVTVYEKYPSNFSLRFAGVGSDVDVFNKVVDLLGERRDFKARKHAKKENQSEQLQETIGALASIKKGE